MIKINKVVIRVFFNSYFEAYAVTNNSANNCVFYSFSRWKY